MKQEITKEHIRNPDALWQWIQKECKNNNIEHISVETQLEEIKSEEGLPLLGYVRGRIVTITLGETFF